MRRITITCLLMSAGLLACDPYDRYGNLAQYNLGGVDPVQFPPAYIGAGGTTDSSTLGVFVPANATVGADTVYYFAFPVTNTDAMGNPILPDPTTAPIGYVFDPTATNPIPAKYGCEAPANYSYNQQRDAVRYDQQGNIFTDLPSDPAYMPIIAQTSVHSSATYPCQELKKEADLLASTEVTVNKMAPDPKLPGSVTTGIADAPAKYLAWAVIDPDATVYFDNTGPHHQTGTLDPVTGLGPQLWGYYNGFLLAYLDGGYVDAVTTGTGAMAVTAVKTQNLYFPAEVLDAMGNPAQGSVGTGFDVLQFKRGDVGYEPVCAVYAYSDVSPGGTPTILTTAADIEALGQSALTLTGYSYCLQVQ